MILLLLLLLVGPAQAQFSCPTYPNSANDTRCASTAFVHNLVSSISGSGATVVAAAGGTTTLTSSSTTYQILTGTGGQTFKLPNATTLGGINSQFVFNNTATGTLTIIDNGSNSITTVPAGGFVNLFLLNASSVNGVWDNHPFMPAGIQWGTAGPTISGTVTGPDSGTWTSSGLSSVKVNGLTITSSANGTLTITAGKTLTSNNTLTFAGTDGSTLNMGTGGTLGPLAFQSAPCTVAQGCTAASSASGTALDNITGFSSTGFLTRTGAGAYTFQSATGGITNANLVTAGAATFKGNPTASTATVQDFTVASLTASVAPDATNDYLVIWDHTAGTFKKINPTTIASSAVAGVSSLNGLTGVLSVVAGNYTTIAAAGSSVTVNTPLVGAFAGAAFGGL